MHEVKTPLIRLAKRDAMPAWQVWCIRGSSFIAAILLGALIFLVLGNNPISAYGTILSGSLGKSTAIRQTVKIAIPLLGTALAIAPCFKMRFWNIGAEGQITAGAVAASYFALFWADRLPGPALILVMAAAGAVAGGIWALVPAFFKAKWGTNETLFTLMTTSSSAWSAGSRAVPGRDGPVPRSFRSLTPRPSCPRCWACTAAGSSCWY